MQKIKEDQGFKDNKIEVKNRSLMQILDKDLKCYSKTGLKISDFIESLKHKSFGVLLVFLSIPSALPIPAPGYSTPFGIILALIGFQILCSKESLQLPPKIQNINFSPKLCEKVLHSLYKFLNRTEKFIKPRMSFMTNKYCLMLIGLAIIIMSLLMIIPIPGTNTLPAMVIFLLAIGMCENDGLIITLGFLLGILSLIFYIFAFFGIATFVQSFFS